MSEMATRYSLATDTYYLGQALFENPDFVRARRRRLIRLLVTVVLGTIALIFFLSLAFDWRFDLVWRYEAVGLLGAAVGTAELLSRYRDAPSFVVLSPPGLLYIAINAGASVLAMGVIQAFDWKFGATGNAMAATQVLIAGLGAMALFRSSLLTVKVGNDDVGIGPSSVLSIMMAASDRAADRLRAADRAGRVYDIMNDVSYKKASDALPTVSVALMQNLGAADIAALRVDLDGLKSKKLPDDTKALLLGLKITNMVSTSVLSAAKLSLGRSILRDETSETAAGHANKDDPVGGPTELTREIVEDELGNGEPSFASNDLPQTPQTPSPPQDAGARGRT